MVEKAWLEDRWEDVGILAQNNVKEAAEYRITSFTESIDYKELRVVVVYSSSLEDTKRKTFSRNLQRREKRWQKKTKKLAKKKFKTKQGADKAVRSFLDQLSEEESLFEYEWEIKTERIELKNLAVQLQKQKKIKIQHIMLLLSLVKLTKKPLEIIFKITLALPLYQMDPRKGLQIQRYEKNIKNNGR